MKDSKKARKIFQVPLYVSVQATTLIEAESAVKLLLVYIEALDLDPEVIGVYLAEKVETDSRGRRNHILHPANMSVEEYNEYITVFKFKVGDVVIAEGKDSLPIGDVIELDNGYGLGVQWRDGGSRDQLSESLIFGPMKLAPLRSRA